MTTTPVNLYLWHALSIFLLFGALLGISLGLLLIFKPQYVERINRVANRWISTRRPSRLLDRSISIERWFYRHHRAAGIIIMLGSAYVFIRFSFLFDQAYTLQRWSSMLPAKMLQALLDALVLGALIFSAVTLLLGLLIFFRPSLLRGLEQQANQWISLRRATKMFDVSRGQVDIFVVRHAQRVGWLLLLGSIYLFFVMLRSLA